MSFQFGAQKITCCHNCEKRHATCHSTCEAYISQKKAYDAKVADYRRERIISDGITKSRKQQRYKANHRRVYRSKYRKGRW